MERLFQYTIAKGSNAVSGKVSGERLVNMDFGEGRSSTRHCGPDIQPFYRLRHVLGKNNNGNDVLEVVDYIFLEKRYSGKGYRWRQ